MTASNRISDTPTYHVELKAPLHRATATQELRAVQEKKQERVAILVCHGMGQQVPFETLDAVARSLHRAEGHVQKQPATTRPISVEIVQLGLKRLARAELELGEEENKKLVHIYEAYWAPFTEGKVTVRDVHRFLCEAAKNALLHCLKSGKFVRWIFGGGKTFTINRGSLVLAFGLALAVLWSLTVMNATIAAVTAARVLTGPALHWPSNGLLADLTIDLALVHSMLLLLGAGFAIALYLKKHHAVGWLSPFIGRYMSVLMVLVWTALMVIVATGVAVASHLAYHGNGANAVWWPRWLGRLVVVGGSATEPELRLVVVLAVWGLTVLLSAKARWFLVQYVGDVAAYVSAHTVSRFWELRQSIFQSSLDVARAVYGVASGSPTTGAISPAGTPEKPISHYDTIIIVGHSLGSVVAYDVLNGLILENRLAPHSSRIIERTRMLLTFGSPLDKTAFIFRTQRPRTEEVREALAAAVQPMIYDYDNRPDWWVNIYSPHDWISGSLEYYDDADDPQFKQKRVRNVRDEQATTPLAAHSEYWSNELVADILYKSAIGKSPV